MKNFVIEYHNFNAVYERAPSSLEELGLTEAELPTLAKQIESGDFVVIWDAVISDNGSKNGQYILGYQRRVEESSGLVILGGGSIEQMTSAEFEAMPKIPTQTAEAAEPDSETDSEED